MKIKKYLPLIVCCAVLAIVMMLNNSETNNRRMQVGLADSANAATTYPNQTTLSGTKPVPVTKKPYTGTTVYRSYKVTTAPTTKAYAPPWAVSTTKYTGTTTTKKIEYLNTTVIDGVTYDIDDKYRVASAVDFDKQKVGKVVVQGSIDGKPVVYFNDGIFTNSPYITSVEFPEAGDKRMHSPMPTWRWFSDCTNLEKVILPSDVTYIPFCAFWSCKNLKEINLPEALEKIYSSAFWGCGLEQITIPKNVNDIDGNCFGFCLSLNSIDVAEENSRYSSVDGVLFNKDKSVLLIYPTGKKTTDYIIPENVEKIDYGAFDFTQNLKSLVIPESVKVIDEQALSFMENFKDLTILNPDCEIFDDKSTITTFMEVTDELDEDGFNVFIYDFTGTIHGYKNSTAQKYAEKYGYKFEAIDGEATTAPVAATTAQVTATKPAATTAVKEPEKIGDPDGDGAINANDATYVLVRYTELSTGVDPGLSEKQRWACDVNNDGKVNEEDRVILGHLQPDVNFGLSSTITWHHLDFFLQLQGATGGQVYNSLRRTLEHPTDCYNVSTVILDSWTAYRPSSTIPKVSDVRPYSYTDSRYIEDADFLKLRTLSVGYRFKLPPVKADIHLTATASNLFTLTGYEGYDPEVQGGIDLGQYPSARTFTIGAEITF